MKHFLAFFFLLGLGLVGLIGCGGEGADTVSDISGFVQDIDGNPVIDARVFVDGGPETFTNSAGAYTLQSAHGTMRTVKATTTQDGVNYYGENVTQLFDGEIIKSVNITMIPQSQRATLQGTVRDRDGFRVEGAHVFVAAINGSGTPTVWNSSVAITDFQGRFKFTTLYGGVSHKVIASARGFNSDTDTITVAAGDTEDLDFTLANATDPLLSPPANVFGIAWTTPYIGTNNRGTGPNMQSGWDAIKQMLHPKRVQLDRGRDTSSGNSFIEVDLDWDHMEHPSLIGFGIYRHAGDVSLGSADFIDFYRDPQATLYEDAEIFFHENETYSYAVTSFNTNAPDTANSESNFSNRVVVHTLDDMNLDPITFGPVTFHWEGGSGATSYQVFVYDRFPSIGVTPLWQGTTANLQLAYGGPALTSGHRYYYVVLGSANGGTSKTMSLIDTFLAP